MFVTSTQRNHWTFKSQPELEQLRIETNQKFINKYCHGEEAHGGSPLSVTEEKLLLRHYEYALKEFCARFKPPMPSYVVGTSVAYMKRFYLHNSVMDYHPKEIMLTSVYLACKVEEFNISIQQFVTNLKGSRNQITEIILGFELLLMQQLHYHLTVHNPFRPFEGLLIDLKTRCTKVTAEAENLRRAGEDFMDKSLNTDVCLLFAPSQIALAAILTSATRNGMNIDNYIKERLLASGNQETFANTVEQVKGIKFMVKNTESLNRDEIKKIEKKLDKCRNQENNPLSEVYKRKMEELLEEEDEIQTQKNVKHSKKEEIHAKELIGL